MPSITWMFSGKRQRGRAQNPGCQNAIPKPVANLRTNTRGACNSKSNWHQQRQVAKAGQQTKQVGRDEDEVNPPSPFASVAGNVPGTWS